MNKEFSNMSDKATSKWLAASNFCTHILIYPLIKYDEVTKKAVLMDDEYKSIFIFKFKHL